MKKVLTIAGSDCSGGAGIQADLKTITAHKMFGMSAVTALTAQNTTGVYGILEADADFVASQLDCIFKDIFPDAVKIGMVSNAGIIEVIASKLKEYGAKNIVVDPVMVATSGSRLMTAGAEDALVKKLIPIADIITPNIPEAEVLWGKKINGADDIKAAAGQIGRSCETSVLIKGGHLSDSADDLLYSYKEDKYYEFPAQRIDNPNTHGTGCTLSSAIACSLADGKSCVDGIKAAKEYITECLKYGLDLGKGSGPLNHTAAL